METKWWDQMDLGPWANDAAPCEVVTMGFAQAVARSRVKLRGVRQRITVSAATHRGRRLLVVADAPEVEEPCS